jgi:heme-degrading monooxygenase HmoA
MYGTVARMKVKPGKEKDLIAFGERAQNDTPGFVSMKVYKSDANPGEYFLTVAFESKEAYQKNAASPEQNARYEEYRALLDADPEWHDGEIIASYPE